MPIKNISAAFLVIILLLSITKSFAQTNEVKCGTFELTEKYKKEIPGYAEQLQLTEQAVNQWIKNHPNFQTRGTVTIPVVIHLLYFAGENGDSLQHQDISDWQITSEIDAMNEDYNRQNADAYKTPGAFLTDTAVTQIQFCLAKTDPKGKPTNGIIRKETTWKVFNDFNTPKIGSQGGDSGWSHDKYLNIWVCSLCCGYLGYSTLPVPPLDSMDGCVIHYKAFGRINTLSKKYNLGRTGTHEAGHWFNLRHTWGDDNNDCSGTDYCDDTPNQGGPTYGGHTYPVTDNCSKSSPGIMFMNYMDYSNDSCMNLFTKDQRMRMWATLYTVRPSILNANACNPDTAYPFDIGISEISSPMMQIKKDSIFPVVTLTNFGSNTVTSATIYYSYNYGSHLYKYNWSGSLGKNATENVSLPALADTTGYQIFIAYTSNPNGNKDADTTNDFKTRSYYVYSHVPITHDHFFIYNGSNPNKIDLNYSQIVLKFDTLSVKDIRQFWISNILGQTVTSSLVTASKISDNELELDVSSLPSGMYFIRVKMANDYMNEKLLVVRP